MAAPTIVLVHGAFADASSWSRLYTELAKDDLTVLAPPNPLRSMTGGDAEYTKSVVTAIDGPVLLVGHSYGGAVITAAGDAENVVGLVYVNGFAPDVGEDLGSLQADFTPPAAGPYLTPGTLPDGGQEFHIAPAGFHEVFCADLSAEEAAFMAIAQRPLSAVSFGEKAAVAAWHDKPTWAIYGTADGSIDPGLHTFSYERMGATVTVVEGASHCVMLSQAPKVAEVVRSAVGALA
jgi:pimeloyl-ACP methyl ester carboxylesterase